MNKSCKNCKSMCKYKVWIGVSGNYHNMMSIKQENDDVVLGVYNGIQCYGIYREPDYDSVTCNNRFSPYYKDGISKNNYCELWESKTKHEKEGLNKFDNYICDGQLVMRFNSDNIEIEEDNNKNGITNIKLI